MRNRAQRPNDRGSKRFNMFALENAAEPWNPVSGVTMQIFAEFENREALVREFESNLGKARAFVGGQFEVSEREEVELVLVHPETGEWLPLRAEVVYIAPEPEAAVGLEILDWSSERADLIQEFVSADEEEPLALVASDAPEPERFELGEPTPHVTAKVAPDPSEGAPPSDEELLLSQASPEICLEAFNEFDEGTASGDPLDEAPFELDSESGSASTWEEEAPSDSQPPRSSPSSSRRSVPPPKNVQERVRRLNVREREAMARSGTLTERVALERAYGAAVWDGLLANGALTGPEVARIAKNGNATIPHLTVIVGNPAWLAKGEVRRALLTNPRLTPPQIERVLRALPPAELKQLPKQTAYAPKVRAVAMRMLSR